MWQHADTYSKALEDSDVFTCEHNVRVKRMELHQVCDTASFLLFLLFRNLRFKLFSADIQQIKLNSQVQIKIILEIQNMEEITFSLRHAIKKGKIIGNN